MLLILGAFFCAPFSLGAEHRFAKAKLLDVQRKTREKVDLYLVNTPVTSAVPYFEIVVRCANRDYTADYTPRHEHDELPESWATGADVEVRVEKHRLWIRSPGGVELPWTIVKQRPVEDKATP